MWNHTPVIKVHPRQMEKNTIELAEKGAIHEVSCSWPCSLCCKPYAMLQTTLRLCCKPHPDPFHTATPRQTFPGSATPALQSPESDFQLWYQENQTSLHLEMLSSAICLSYHRAEFTSELKQAWIPFVSVSLQSNCG